MFTVYNIFIDVQEERAGHFSGVDAPGILKLLTTAKSDFGTKMS